MWALSSLNKYLGWKESMLLFLTWRLERVMEDLLPAFSLGFPPWNVLQKRTQPCQKKSPQGMLRSIFVYKKSNAISIYSSNFLQSSNFSNVFHYSCQHSGLDEKSCKPTHMGDTRLEKFTQAPSNWVFPQWYFYAQ